MDKFDRLLDALDHPGNFDEKELIELLSDPEIEEAYRIILATRHSLTVQHEIDVDRAWRRFAQRSIRVKPFAGLFRRHLAATVGCALALGTTAAVIGISFSRNGKSPDITSPATLSAIPASQYAIDTVTRADSVTLTVSTQPIIFENCPLAEILSEIGEHYGKSIVFTSEIHKKTRLYFKWDKSLRVEEVVKLLNNFNRFSLSLSENIITVK